MVNFGKFLSPDQHGKCWKQFGEICAPPKAQSHDEENDGQDAREAKKSSASLDIPYPYGTVC